MYLPFLVDGVDDSRRVQVAAGEGGVLCPACFFVAGYKKRQAVRPALMFFSYALFLRVIIWYGISGSFVSLQNLSIFFMTLWLLLKINIT